MKRAITYWLICFVLGFSAYTLMRLAILNSSIFYGIFAIMTIIASVLHIAPDESDKE